MMVGPWLEKLHAREDLTAAEAAAAMAPIMDGAVTPSQVAALLVALRMKGERPSEIVGFATTMRARAVPLARAHPGVFDTCGTGGDGASSVNVSSMAALVVAACGVPVAKHGNRAVSSRSGSADVFEALGVRVDAPPPVVEQCLEQAGIAFFFAPAFHPSMRHAAPTRRELGVRTAFNLLGPLTNPAGARRQLVGVPRPELTELVARALAALGSEHAWVVHGADGLDEISTCGYTKVSACRAGLVTTFFVHPSDFGLPRAHAGDIAGGDAAENADCTRRLVAGTPGAVRDIVLLNAAVALLIAGRVASVREGLSTAADAIDAGTARRVLDAMVAWSHAKVPA